MKRLSLLAHLALLATTTTTFATPVNNLPKTSIEFANVYDSRLSQEWVCPATYDEILQMLDDLESGELEQRYSPAQLEAVNQYLALLAKEGVLPNEFEENFALQEDIQDLMYGEDSAFHLTRYLEGSGEYQIAPLILNGDADFDIIWCGKASKAWKKTKKFIKKHKKAIIIGAIVVTAVVAVTVAVVVVSSTTAGSAVAGAVTGAVAASVDVACESNAPQTSYRMAEKMDDISSLRATMEEKISSFKTGLSQELLLMPPNTEGSHLSLEETGRVIGSLFAHESFEQVNRQMTTHPQLFKEAKYLGTQANLTVPPDICCNPVEIGHQEIDKQFSSYSGSFLPHTNSESSFNALAYQRRGEAAYSYGYYQQAVEDFSKAISINPTDSTLYLQRSSTHFDLGNYEQSLEDFHYFTTQTEQSHLESPLSILQFSLGFSKGVSEGVYESGRGILVFLADFALHPIYSSAQVVQALATLADLAHNDEWGSIGEALVPEIAQLIQKWDSLSSCQRGELAGYALGKIGGDVLVPGALAKVAAKSAKGAQELVAVIKHLQAAERTLVLEAATGVGSATRMGEIVEKGSALARLGEELGVTSSEIGSLHRTGNLENAIIEKLEKVVSQTESEVLKSAISNNKNVKMARDYLGKSAREIQKGIISYEKQIFIHKDKIKNPNKYYPDWNKLDIRQREALINKKWPTEIRGFEEQKNLLEAILREREGV